MAVQAKEGATGANRPAGGGWRRMASVAPVLTASAAAVATSVTAPGTFTADGWAGWVIVAGFLSFAGAGALILWFRPGHGVGLLLAWGGAVPFLSTLIEVLTPRLERGSSIAQIAGEVLWAGTFAALLGALIAFPDGALISPRWWPGVWLIVGGAAGVALSEVATLADTGGPVIPTVVVTIAGWLAAAFPAATVVVVASIVVRLVRGGPVERRQFGVLLVGVVATFLGLFAAELSVLDRLIGQLDDVIFGAALAMTPVSIVVAVLRYRLYDVGRVLRRTVAYTVVTATVVGVYAGSVLVAQSLVGPASGSDVIVAGATLAAAGLFRPLAQRVQRRIDRRFNRASFDAEQTLDRFSVALRDEVDLVQVRAALLGAVHGTVSPLSATVWLLDGDDRPGGGTARAPTATPSSLLAPL